MAWQATAQACEHRDLPASWQGASIPPSIGMAMAGVIGAAMSMSVARSAAALANQFALIRLAAMGNP